jgi:hypothetical protein
MTQTAVYRACLEQFEQAFAMVTEYYEAVQAGTVFCGGLRSLASDLSGRDCRRRGAEKAE